VIARLKAILKFIWVVALFSTGSLWLAKRRARLGGQIIVLTLHRVLDDSEFERSSSLRGIRVRARTFERFADWVSRHFEVVESDDAPAGEASTRVRMVLTFDDGWVDTYTRAHPILARHGLPFTVFVCSGLAGQAGPFWPERVCRLLRAGGRQNEEQEQIIEKLKRLPEDHRRGLLDKLEATSTAVEEVDELDRLMTWDQVRWLQGSGVTIGSHTITHPILTGISARNAFDELAGSRRQIERALDTRCRAVAYPNGNVTPEIRDTAADAGYAYGFIAKAGYWNARTDPLRIPRVNVWEGKLTGPAGRFSRAMAEYSIFWLTPR
jgi:peptidoglycan/xylan/chitin deacetylase (PgdA/CDA1 family)